MKFQLQFTNNFHSLLDLHKGTYNGVNSPLDIRAGGKYKRSWAFFKNASLHREVVLSFFSLVSVLKSCNGMPISCFMKFYNLTF